MINQTNSYIGNKYKKNGQEVFQWKKFNTGFFGLLDPLGWIKDIVSIFNIRKLIIYAIIAGLIFGYGWWQGRQNTPVNVKLEYGKEAFIKLNGNQLHIDKDGNVYLEDKDGNVIKQIKAKDITGLKSQLSAIGLQLKPFVLVGASAGSYGDVGIEAGAGVSFFRIAKINLDAFLTNRGIYGGASYKLTDNSGIGAGVGKGWYGDTRAIIYYKFEF